MGIDTKLLPAILIGEKNIVGRLRMTKFVTLRIGDKIHLREDDWQEGQLVQSADNAAVVIVTKTQFYDSFTDMLNVIDISKLVTPASSQEAILKNYYQFYTVDQEIESGVVAIEFRLQ